MKESLKEALKNVKKAAGFTRKICIEVHSPETYFLVTTLEEVDIIMLDHFEPNIIESCANKTAAEAEATGQQAKRKLLEVSGGITLDNIAPYMLPCNRYLFFLFQVSMYFPRRRRDQYRTAHARGAVH